MTHINTLTMETNTRTVMLIDDCTIDNYVNRKMIMHYNFAKNIEEFQDSMSAMEHLRKIDSLPMAEQLAPDFIFLDLNMPVMDGNEFLQHYDKLSHKIKGKTRIVVLSGSIAPGELSLSTKNPHVLAFINKPLIKMNLDLIESLVTASKERRFLLLKRA